jgi:CrcB protein
VWALGTLNVSGSAVLGLLVALAVARTWSAPLRLGLAAGFCGGLTSLSSLALRLGDSIETGDPWSAAAEVALSVALGIVCYRVGVWLGESGRSSTRASPIRRAQA